MITSEDMKRVSELADATMKSMGDKMKIKKLEWKEAVTHLDWLSTWVSDVGVLRFTIQFSSDKSQNGYLWFTDTEGFTHEDGIVKSLDEAKQACQDHFESIVKQFIEE